MPDQAPSPEVVIEQAIEALEAHEAWDDDLLLNGDWTVPTLALTPYQLESFRAIREKCNAALASLRAAQEPAP
jgi:hypothetical protein